MNRHFMPYLIAILVAIGFVWLVRRVSCLRDQAESLSRTLDSLQQEASRLKERLDQYQAGPTSMPVEPSTPDAARQFTTERGATETTSAPPPIIPISEKIAPPPAEPQPVAPPPLVSPRVEAAFAQTSELLKPIVNWEQFMGVKLFAWIGGLALFLGMAFFVKYSFEKNLIPPAVRVAIGFLTGLGLLVGGVLMKRKEYAVTAQTLCATGIVILYAVTFTCRSIYHFEFFGLLPTLLLMSLITATGFLLAVRLNAMVVAILGMLGGFLTPILVSEKVDNPFGLFGYIALLDIGLIAVALHRRWNFLVTLGAIGTVAMQIGWVATFFVQEKYFEGDNIFTPVGVFLGFNLLFLMAFVWCHRRQLINTWVSAAAIGLPFVSLAFTFFFLSFPDLGQRPGVIFTYVFLADVCLLVLVWLKEELGSVQLGAGAAVFLLLSVWTLWRLTDGLLNWALGFYLLFAMLHSAFPIVLQRLRPGKAPAWWGQLFPPLALLLIMLPMIKLTEVSLVVWPVVLLVDLLAIGLGILTASLLAIVAVLILTLAATALWIFKIPAELTDLPVTLLVIGGFAVIFFGVGIFAMRKFVGQPTETRTAPASSHFNAWLPSELSPELVKQIPAMSAILPFLLLMMVSARLPLANPSPIFGLALLLIVLLLGLTKFCKMDWLPAVGLACVLALEHTWHFQHFQLEHLTLEHAWRSQYFQLERAALPLGWYLLFFAIFAAFPFLFYQSVSERIVPWAVAALSGPLHFFLVHRLVKSAYPNEFMGLLPAAFALPMLLGLVFIIRNIPSNTPTRNDLLAWFGGAALFFITLIFPIQFDKQWITVAWALEGAALLWLFHRVPHSGLRYVGIGLLLVAFVRLALNPTVLSYHARSATPILNWYLYAYGIVTACLFTGARLLAPPRNVVLGSNTPPLLNGLGIVLAFLLLNIEIADYFTKEEFSLTFQFSGNFARDMTYSIAWALFALGLLIIGIAKKIRAIRYASLGLLSVTLLKLFFHDLANLAQLYRIGALIVVAVIAIVASFLYQRFLAADTPRNETESNKPPPA